MHNQVYKNVAELKQAMIADSDLREAKVVFNGKTCRAERKKFKDSIFPGEHFRTPLMFDSETNFKETIAVFR